jgi:hypothetical protein
MADQERRAADGAEDRLAAAFARPPAQLLRALRDDDRPGRTITDTDAAVPVRCWQRVQWQ